MPQKFQHLKKSRGRKKSSHKWLLRQINDPFVERARLEGWKSRAAFKIIEIDEKFKLFKKGKIVVDLGAAPGGWSQYAIQKVGAGNVVAIDLLEIDPIAGVNFFQQDFQAEDAAENIIEELKKISHNKTGLCDVVISDMAANTTGDHGTDHLRIISLLEDALEFSSKILKKNGSFVGKIFQGGSSDEIVKQLRGHFSQVKYFKPKSSRKDSSETYLVATGFKKQLSVNSSQRTVTRIIFGLGSNLGNRESYLNKAVEELGKQLGLSNVKRSEIFANPALLLEGSPKEWDREFYNIALSADINLENFSPEKILEITQGIERKLERDHNKERWAPREIDIDIIAIGDMKIEVEDKLKIPHYDLFNRDFFLKTVGEIEPELLNKLKVSHKS